MDEQIGHARRMRHYLLEPGHAEPPRTYERARVCAAPDCSTKLSMYNRSAFCSVHWQLDPALGRRLDLHPQKEVLHRRCAFDGCGRPFATSNPARKYCSNACRLRAHHARVAAVSRAAQLLAREGDQLLARRDDRAA